MKQKKIALLIITAILLIFSTDLLFANIPNNNVGNDKNRVDYSANQKNWFSTKNYSLAISAVTKNFESLPRIQLLKPITRTWPQPGDAEFGKYKPRTQILMSYVHQNTDANNLGLGDQVIHKIGGSFVGDDSMWLTVQGKMFSYLNTKEHRKQWDLSVKCETAKDQKKNQYKPKNPCNRVSAVVGMYNSNKAPGYGYNTKIATLWIDESAVFRPNLFQKISITSSGAPVLKSSSKFDWEGLLKKWDVKNFKYKGETKFSDWYSHWWKANVVTGGFPWTGHGYTYDWYYGKNTKKAVGLSEFVVLPSTMKHQWHYEVVANQAINDYLTKPWMPKSSNIQASLKD